MSQEALTTFIDCNDFQQDLGIPRKKSFSTESTLKRRSALYKADTDVRANRLAEGKSGSATG